MLWMYLGFLILGALAIGGLLRARRLEIEVTYLQAGLRAIDGLIRENGDYQLIEALEQIYWRMEHRA
jgi:hypothetical protein